MLSYPIPLPNENALANGTSIYDKNKIEVFKPLAGNYALTEKTTAVLTQEEVYKAFQANLTLKDAIQIITYSLAAGDTVSSGNPFFLLAEQSTPLNLSSTSTGATETIIVFRLPFSLKFSLFQGFELAIAGASTNYFAVDILDPVSNAYVQQDSQSQNGAGNLRSVTILNNITTNQFRYRIRIDNGNQCAIYPLLVYINP